MKTVKALWLSVYLVWWKLGEILGSPGKKVAQIQSFKEVVHHMYLMVGACKKWHKWGTFYDHRALENWKMDNTENKRRNKNRNNIFGVHWHYLALFRNILHGAVRSIALWFCSEVPPPGFERGYGTWATGQRGVTQADGAVGSTSAKWGRGQLYLQVSSDRGRNVLDPNTK